MKTLLTGFGAFGGVVRNPSERLVRHFEAQGIRGHDLTTCVMPVSYRDVSRILLGAIRGAEGEGRPFDLIWMLGVAAGSPHWRVERFGRRVAARAPDMDGATAPDLDDSAPEALPSTVPCDRIVSAMAAAGVPVVASDSAGEYLCNHALYTALSHARHERWISQIGFLHVPADPVTMKHARAPEACFSFDLHLRAVEVSLEALGRPAGRDSEENGVLVPPQVGSREA